MMLSTRLLKTLKAYFPPLRRPSIPLSSTPASTLSHRTYAKFPRRNPLTRRGATAATVFGGGSVLAVTWLKIRNRTLFTPEEELVPFRELIKGDEALPIEEAVLTLAPNVPPPINRDYPVSKKTGI